MIVQVVAITWSCDVRKDFNQIAEVYVTFSFARGGKVKLRGRGVSWKNGGPAAIPVRFTLH